MEHKFIQNLQNKPEPVKKTIMWAGISCVMFIVFIFWLFTFPFKTSQPINDEGLANITKEVPSAWQALKEQISNLQSLWSN